MTQARESAASVAAYCLQFLRESALQVGDDELVEIEHGFAWWPGPVRQVVTAEPLGALPADAVEVSIRTDVWRDADPMDPVLAVMRNRGIASAVIVTDGLVQIDTTLIVFPEIVGWQTQLLSWCGALQIDQAQAFLDDACFGLGGVPATSARDGGDPKTEWDTLTGVRGVLADNGAAVADEVLAPAVLAATVDQMRLHTFREVSSEPVDHPDAAGVWSVDRPWTALPREARESPLGEMTVRSYVALEAVHPVMGRGFGIRTLFPLPVEDAISARMIAGLNSIHPLRSVRIGSWMPVDDGLIVQTFLPAGMLSGDRPGSLANVLSYHERMLWPALELYIDLTPDED